MSQHFLLSVETLRNGKKTLKHCVSARTGRAANNWRRASWLPEPIKHYKSINDMPVFDTWAQADAYRSALVANSGISYSTMFIQSGQNVHPSQFAAEFLETVGLDPNYDPTYANRMMMAEDEMGNWIGSNV